MTRAPHLLLVEAPYYAHIAALLRQGAEAAIAAAGATFEIVSVPGAFEIPPAIALPAKAGGRFLGFGGLSEEWPLARMETLLRLILGAGASELVPRPAIPPRVTMSEYVAIAYAFF